MEEKTPLNAPLKFGKKVVLKETYETSKNLCFKISKIFIFCILIQNKVLCFFILLNLVPKTPFWEKLIPKLLRASF